MRYQREMSALQYLASSPRHMPTHTNRSKKGSNPPFLFSLGSQAQLKAKQKKTNFPPNQPCNSSAHPQLLHQSWTFVSDADLNQVLTVTILAPGARHRAHAMQSQPHILPLFLHGSLWGHTSRHNQHPALHPSPFAVATALIAQQETRFITLVPSPFPGVLPCMSQSATRRSVAAG